MDLEKKIILEDLIKQIKNELPDSEINNPLSCYECSANKRQWHCIRVDFPFIRVCRGFWWTNFTRCYNIANPNYVDRIIEDIYNDGKKERT